jgi:hypothetical protein
MQKSYQANAPRHAKTGRYDETERRAAGNSTYKKLAVQCSADSFVVNQSLVLRINICGKKRQLRVAANRYRQP